MLKPLLLSLSLIIPITDQAQAQSDRTDCNAMGTWLMGHGMLEMNNFSLLCPPAKKPSKELEIPPSCRRAAEISEDANRRLGRPYDKDKEMRTCALFHSR